MAADILRVDRVREILVYDRETGVFRYRVDRRRVRAGDVAGNKTPRGYVRIVIDGQRCQAHRLAWLYETGEWPTLMVDHKDGNTSNNAWTNLRQANAVQNGRNRRPKIGSLSGVVGVTWCNTHKRWQATLSLGYFDDLTDAAKARRLAERAVFGEFVRGN